MKIPKLPLAKLGIYLWLALIGLYIVQTYKGCVPRTPEGNEILKPSEKEKVIIKGGDVSHTQRRDGRQVVYRNSGADTVTVTLTEDGKLHVKQDSTGFVFRPALSLAVADDGLRIGADVEFYFIRNVGFLTGLNTPIKGHGIRAYIGTSYRLPVSFMRNTSVYVAYDTKREVQIGGRVRF